MKNALRVTALSLLVVVALAGCFKGKIDLTLSSDNTASGTMLFAIQKGVGESLGVSDEDLLGEFTGDVSGDLKGATSEPYDEDGYIGTLYRFADQPLDAFDTGDEGSDVGITRDGDTFVIDGTWSTDDADTEGMDPASLGAEFTFNVTFPGKVTDTNGAVSDDGHTVTWDLLNPPDTLHAVGGATEGGSGSLVWIIIAAVVVLLLAAAVVFFLLRKRGTAGETPDAVEAPAVEDEAPPTTA